MNGPAQRIAVIGAECTGKTSLCEALEVALPAVRIGEYLREFTERMGRPPLSHEQRGLMAEQMRRENEALARASERGLAWVVCDSTPLITALCSIHYFADDSLLSEAIAHQRGYAHTLLADIDIPWEADGIQRDGPEVRAQVQRMIVATLERHGIAAATITGCDEARREAALRVVVQSRRAMRSGAQEP